MSLTAISSLESARRKLFMNQTYQIVKKVAIERFCAQEAEMSLTAISTLESVRRKFFVNATYILSRNWESNVFR